MALALVLCHILSLGLANRGYILEILVEGSGIVNVDIASLFLALILCLVPHYYRCISNAIG